MKERNCILVLVFNLLTAGIYGIYWIVSVQNGLKRKTGMGYSGGVTILAMVFSFGIYTIYWYYVLGKRLHAAGASKDNGIIYLVLVLLGNAFGAWIVMFLAQEEINNIVAIDDDDEDDGE